MTDTRVKVDRLINEALESQHVDRLLETVCEVVIERINADPELREYIVRETVRGKVISSFWSRKF